MKRTKLILFILIIQFNFGLNLILHDYDNPSASHILDAHITENILIIVGMLGGIEIYDISNPIILNHLANFNLPNNGGGGGSKPKCVSTYNNYAYITAKNGVAIINLENPSNPQFIGYIPNTNNMILENLDIEDNILAVCAHTDGVLFFDLMNPENPNLIHIHEADNAWAVEIVNNIENENKIIYVGSNSNVEILELNNTNLELLYTMEFNHAVKDIIENDLVLYVAFGTDGVKALGLSGWLGGTQDSPNILDHYNTAGMANRMSKFDNNIAVSDWDDVEILNWNWATESLIKTGYKNTTRRTMAIATKENFIYSAEWNSVQVMEYGEIVGADIDLNTYELNYPYVVVGDSYTMPLEIINNGNSELHFEDIFSTNPEFIINNFSNLMPGESQTIEVTYTATEENASGGLRIWSNDNDEPDIVCETNGNIDGANIGEAAPDFELEIVANGEGSFRLSDHLGEIVVLVFFAPS